MGKYCSVRQPTDDEITRRMRIAFRIPKATDPPLEYVTFIAFPQQKIVTRQCYVACTRLAQRRWVLRLVKQLQTEGRSLLTVKSRSPVQTNPAH